MPPGDGKIDWNKFPRDLIEVSLPRGFHSGDGCQRRSRRNDGKRAARTKLFARHGKTLGAYEVKLKSFAIFAQLKPSGDYRRRWSKLCFDREKEGVYEKSTAHNCRTNDCDFTDCFRNWSWYGGSSSVLSRGFADCNRCTYSKPGQCSWSPNVSTSVKAMEILKRFRNRRGSAPLTTAAAVAFITCFLFAFGASCFLYATHVKSGAAAGNRPAATETAGPFGEVIRGPRGKSQIALTFDGGADAECFEDLIGALSRAHVNSTFFITGRFTREHADCAVEITKYGHEIGNHTWSHLNLTKQSDDVVQDEILRAEHAIARVSAPKSQTEMASSFWRPGRSGPENCGTISATDRFTGRSTVWIQSNRRRRRSS